VRGVERVQDELLDDRIEGHEHVLRNVERADFLQHDVGGVRRVEEAAPPGHDELVVDGHDHRVGDTGNRGAALVHGPLLPTID
jgi:hypothetical protein